MRPVPSRSTNDRMIWQHVGFDELPQRVPEQEGITRLDMQLRDCFLYSIG